jgi:hypothetical protein
LKFNNNKTTFKEFYGCLGIGLCSIWWFVFWVFYLSILRGHNFLYSIIFLMILNALDASIGRVQVLFRCQKQWSPPLGFGLPWVVKCYSCNSIATNEQLKELTYMFCLWIPCYKIYKKGLFSYVFTLKYMCHFGMNRKKLNSKAKHKLKKQIHGYSLVDLVLCFFTYLPTYLWLCMTNLAIKINIHKFIFFQNTINVPCGNFFYCATWRNLG